MRRSILGNNPAPPPVAGLARAEDYAKHVSLRAQGVRVQSTRGGVECFRSRRSPREVIVVAKLQERRRRALCTGEHQCFGISLESRAAVISPLLWVTCEDDDLVVVGGG